jgi:hypothetical protein
MPAARAPALSAILCVDHTRCGAETVAALRREAREVPLELVLVGVDGHRPDPPDEAADFAAVRLVVHEGVALSDARTDGIRAATAPYVAITETHSFPQRGWASGIVRRLDEGWAAVGPAIGPANPVRKARAMTVFDYGRWMGGPQGPWPDLPGHNSAYRRDAVLAALEQMPDGMDAETLLQVEMRRAGGKLYLDMGIHVAHLNVEQYGAAGNEWRDFSRVYAARRAANWGFLRRAVYAAGSPLLPMIRLARLIRSAQRGGYLGPLLGGLDIVFVALVGSAFGEMLGYLTLRCDPSATLEVELHRRRWAPSAPSASGI